MDYAKESLKRHYEWKGKIETKVRADVNSAEALSLAYTPGVAAPCLEIQKHPEKSFELTRRWNTVAVVTDGTAILGLGDIGPEAGMPVMEGKCALFKAFGDVDAVPICIRSKDVDTFVDTICLIAVLLAASTSRTSRRPDALRSRKNSKKNATSWSSTMTSTARQSLLRRHSSMPSRSQRKKSESFGSSLTAQALPVLRSETSSSRWALATSSCATSTASSQKETRV